MSSESGYNGGSVIDYELPHEILSVIPTDPYDQLDLARKITSMAIASRVKNLEFETDRLQQKISEKDNVIRGLQDKILRLESMLQEMDTRHSATLEENVKLSSERDALEMKSKKMARDLAKLEKFKQQLMRSLNNENSPSHEETVEIGTCDPSISRLSSLKDTTNSEADEENVNHTRLGIDHKDATANFHKFSMTPYITPRLTPSATPKIISTVNSPKTYSTKGSPKMLSGATSPTKSLYDGRNMKPPLYLSSQQSSARNSPPHARSISGQAPRIDGKEFFRQARNRLTYEQFGSFLANIKELNAHKQSREETLRKTEEIFGAENRDLYATFQRLLSRNVS